MTSAPQFSPIDPSPRPHIADQVFAELYRKILTLELAPGAKISEVDIAKAMGVSRQPVRDAFYRLSKLGFLEILPQRATTISLISARSVLQARFIRTALEKETVAAAARIISNEQLELLTDLTRQQDELLKEGDKLGFQGLDDEFHRQICIVAGLEFAWQMIQESKGHMDRVRLLSLSFASREAWDDHLSILQTLKDRDPVAAAQSMEVHLSRISALIEPIRAANFDWFQDEQD